MSIRILIVLAMLLAVHGVLFADGKDNSLAKEIPLDSKVRTGKLDNGLRYFIRHNDKPEKRLVLRLVVNAGSVLEDEDQLGIAHYTEHMAFNGTKNFAKNDLVDYLQSVGVRFGSHLNAYTSFEETVYILPIPCDKEEIVDRGFQILEDWAHQITFDEDEIKKELGVVTEEWRIGQGARARMLKQILPVLLKGSRHAERLPIGEKEVFSKFTRETFLRFYRDWYRPDLMAVVAVGDMDVEKVEAKIKKHFSHIAMAKEPRPRKSYSIPDHQGTVFKVIADPEFPTTQAILLYKHDTKPFVTEGDYRQRIVYSLFSLMMNQRLNELTQRAEPPFVYGAIAYDRMFGMRNKDAYQAFAMTREDGILQGIQALVEENMRVKHHGFTESELGRAKKILLQQYKQAFNERDKTESSRFVSEYVSYFLQGIPSPGIEYEYRLHQKYTPTIALAEINELAKTWVRNDNNVVLVLAPQRPGLKLPTEDEIEKMLTALRDKQLSAYQDEGVDRQLVKELPEPGTVVEETHDEKLGTTDLLLSNGVRVVLKPTDFKNDQILMSVYSPGGTSLLTDEEYFASKGLIDILTESGVGDFSSIELAKALAGKTVSVSPFLNEMSEGFQGNATPDSLETLLQLVYLWYTKPRRDETAFHSTINKEKAFYKNMGADPQTYFYDQGTRFLSQNHPRYYLLPKEQDWDRLKLDEMVRIYRERFANAADFTFFFVGNFSVKELQPLLCKYIGSLPTNEKRENWKDLGVRPPSGIAKKEYYKGTAPKSEVYIQFSGDMEYSGEEGFYVETLAELMTNRLIERMREEKGGVYSGRVSGKADKYPVPRYNINTSFPCAPENVDDLVQTFFAICKDIREKGVEDKEVDKIKEGQLRSLEVGLKTNRFWLFYLQDSHVLGYPRNEILLAKQQIEALNAQKLQQTAQKYLDLENYIQLVLYPESHKESSK